MVNEIDDYYENTNLDPDDDGFDNPDDYEEDDYAEDDYDIFSDDYDDSDS